jgi:two-component system sensor histidine kinase TctE
MIGAPLIHAGNPVGVILFWSRRGAIPAEYDLGTLSAFANAGAAEMALWKMSYLWGQFVHKVGNYSMPIVNAGTYLKQMPLDTAGMAVVEQFDASASLLRATLRTTIEYRKLLARQPKQERFCAIGCLLEVIKSQESAADAKNVTIKRPAVPKRQVEVEGDREMLSDAFANLISNAIRYTKQNSEVIAASTVKAGFLEITISDFGPGVPAENRPHIFLPYMSLPTDGHHRSGLGLASARHGVNANGGKVELVISKRQPTSGASFRIRLPLRRPDKPDMI